MRKHTWIGLGAGSFLVLLATVIVLPAPGRNDGTKPLIEVRCDRPGPRLDSAMWGIFFEDINFAADGGLCAELVKNRSFEFARPLTGWYEIRPAGARGSLTVRSDDPVFAENPHYLRLDSLQAGPGYGAGNEGFRGMGFRGSEEYTFALQLRASGSAPLALRVDLKGDEGKVLASGRLDGIARAWSPRQLTLRPESTAAAGSLELVIEGTGRLDIDAVSLRPRSTWKNHGLRIDLMELIADLRPGFVRFPGGCIVEGADLDNRYLWKQTIGERDRRRPMVNRWADAMVRENRVAPDYYQSFDLGFFEFFQLCEDLGAEPFPVLNCGMACQFQSGELAPLDELDPYIQDALDLIEFANGAADSSWGSRRAAMGHPAPFNLKTIGVGNEQWGDEYVDRFKRFRAALREHHPEILVVGSAGPFSGGEWFEHLWRTMPAAGADMVDEHYYAPPAWFLAHADRYDRYARNGPPVFAGEYAAHPPVDPILNRRPNSWEGALAEAAFMTGLERNGDLVRRASYAPLLAHVNAWQWAPNLIWFDNLRTLTTPSYQVQKLFSRNRGDVILPLRIVPPPATQVHLRLYASATLDERAGEIVLKVVNAAATPVTARLVLAGRPRSARGGSCLMLHGAPGDSNSIDKPNTICPEVSACSEAGSRFDHEFPAHSSSVLRLPAK
jgi:alpha-N-arabinofuranosidase